MTRRSRFLSVRDGVPLFTVALAAILAAPFGGFAETPAQSCDRLAGDAVNMKAIDGERAVAACAGAVAAAPQDTHLEYEYARALERTAKGDQAKQIYKWIAADGYAPANAALARIAGPLTGDAAEREKFAQRLDAIATIAGRIAKSTPRDHDDPNTVLAKTGKDPIKILAWVKANTRIVPYAGMLRGASGVLMDRAGNSLDRALFLADLLHRAGFNVRIARAQISQEAAEALRVRFVSSASKPPPAAVPDKAAILKAIGRDPRLDPKLLEQTVDQTIAASRNFNTDVKDIYGEVLPAVLQAIGDDPARDARIAADADNLLRDHFWVQQQNRGGWADLDPDSDIVGKPGANTSFSVSALPSDLKQRVTLRLMVETLKDGKLSEGPLLQQTFLPAEVADKPIVIGHALYPQVPIDTVLKRANPQADFVQGIADATVVMPTLQVGSQLIKGQLYDFSGRIQEPTPESLASMGGTAMVNGQALARGIASAFGDAPSAAPPGRPQDIVTAEWLEFDIALPGKAVEKHRRAIFDVIGTVARANPATISAPALTDALRKQRALALSATIDAFVFGATPSTDWCRRMTMDVLSKALPLAANMARTRRSLADMPRKTENQFEPQLWAWAENRIASTLLRESAPSAPNIALLWQEVKPDSLDRLNVAFDIVTNEAISDTSFAHRVAQGVMDTIMEHATLTSGSADPNTAVQHAADIGAGRKWALLQSPSAVSGLSAPANIQALVGSSLAAGDMVIAPPVVARVDQYAWWRIDPRSGETLGIGRKGMGTSMAEYALILDTIGAGLCLIQASQPAYNASQKGTSLPNGQITLLRKQAGFCLIGLGLSMIGFCAPVGDQEAIALIGAVADTGGEGLNVVSGQLFP